MNRSFSQLSSRKGRLLRGMVLALMGLGAAVLGQAQAISVTDTTGWNAWTLWSGAVMTDPMGDQQTGQGQDDIVGDATRFAMQQKAGLLGGVESIAFRARMDKWDSKGFGGNLELGMDLDGNGGIDFVMKLSDKSGQTLSFATPGTGTNDSPATTSWGTFAGALTLTSATYNYQTAGGTQFGTTPDAWVSFAISYANLQTAIQTYAGAAFSSFVVNNNTAISFIAFTSTQGNAINQDLFGTAGNTNSTSTFAALGAGTGPLSPYGVIPEPATYAQFGTLLAAAAFLAWRKRRAMRAAADANRATQDALR